MNTKLYKSTGISLITGALLAMLTMLLHPAGGDLHHIQAISKPLQMSHALAIFCVPFILFGFYGLMYRLSHHWKLSTLAFIFVAFGLFAAMLAALFNGLVLPSFLDQYTDNLSEHETIISPIVAYGFAINKALDYVFMVALCVSILIYSINVFMTKKLSKWLGYLGLLIFTLFILGVLSDFMFTSLTGFRVFVFSIAGWIFIAGLSQLKTTK